MTKYIFLFGVALGLSLGLTPLARLLALRFRVLDLPGERKVHKTPTPLLGGTAVFLAFNTTIFLWLAVSGENLYAQIHEPWYALPIGLALIMALGIYDDVKRLRPRTKLAVQVFVGLLAVLAGFSFGDIASPLDGRIIHLGFWAYPLTVLWVVGITNALNLVDGLDGLAAGTATIAGIAVCAIAFVNQNVGESMVALVLVGALLGFLRYNFFPARIFLGDSGSLLLGFLLALLSIEGTTKGAVLVAVLAPVLALGLPIMDMLISMIRRTLSSLRLVETGQNGKAKILFSMFEADREHIHHRLLKLGYSHRTSVIILYALCAGLCGLALITVAVHNLNVTALLGALFVIVLVGVRGLRYQEFKILGSGILLPLFQFPAISKSAFIAFFDLVSCAAAYLLSYLLSVHGAGVPAKATFLSTLGFVLVFKLGAFNFSHFYKGSWLNTQLDDLLGILRVIVLTSLGMAAGLCLIFGLKAFGAIFFILDFYLTLTFVAGFRISYRVVYGVYNRTAPAAEKRILIYGAGQRAATVISEIRRNYAYAFSPIGFIDDDPKKTGRLAFGCPVLGTADDLEAILTRHHVLEIIISTERIGQEKIDRLVEFCRGKGIAVRQFQYRFYEFS